MQMLRKAHIGVSISASEEIIAMGTEADVTLESFGPLAELILKHGFSARMRLLKLFNLLVGRHLLLVAVMVAFEFANGFSLVGH